jgi:hypothetical protein
LIYSPLGNWEHPLFLRNPEFLTMSADERDERDELTSESEALHREIGESGELIVTAAHRRPAW